MPSRLVQVGDARELLALGPPPGSVDCIITSPPYWDLKRYGQGHEQEIGHAEPTYEDYVLAVGDVLRDCLALSKPDGVLWLVADTLRARGEDRGRQLPLPFDIAREATKRGWRLQETIVWVKNKTLPYSGEGKLRNRIEYVLFFTRSRTFEHHPYRFAERHLPKAKWLAGWPERYHPLGNRPSNVWRFNIPDQGMWSHSERLHFCPFPQELVARCIGLTTNKGDLVFDPFAGVGTVPAQAVAMGRRGAGVELNATNVQLFEERTMPTFQREWEKRAYRRRLSQEDQRDEAHLILKLRILKAGKELMRLCERMAQSKPTGHPSASVESVIVREGRSCADLVDVESGEVSRPLARVALVAAISPEEAESLSTEIRAHLSAPPFSGLSTDIELEVVTPDQPAGLVPDEGQLCEFGQSRHGAFTTPLDERLFESRPRLLTTMRLPAPVHAGGKGPLDIAKHAAERQLLQRELGTGGTTSEIAGRLGVARSKLDALLLEHGLQNEPKSFAVALPDQRQVPIDGIG